MRRPLNLVTLAASLVFVAACNRAPANKAANPAKIAAAPQSSQPSAPTVPVSSATAAQASSVSSASSATSGSAPPQSAGPAKLVAAENTETFTVAQHAFRLVTHTQTIEGKTDETTVDWWELRNDADHVIYRGTSPANVENGSFAETLAINGSAFKTDQGGGILIHGFELPSAPDDGGWVQVFGFKYGREKNGLEDNLFGPFGPPISVEGEFLDVSTDPLRASASALHDVLRFRLRTGNFSIIYPVLINWVTGQLQPAWRCPEITAKGQVDRCTYPVKVEANRESQPTFVRLFPEPDGGTPKHIIVQPGSKVEFIEAKVPVTWNQDDKAISFNLDGDNWLKVRIDGVEGWIHGEEDFDALGLPQSG